jgi:hypothetical protein
LLLGSISAHQSIQHLVQRAAYVARENEDATILNAYKNYNLDKQEIKSQEASNQWGADKSALELAEEMNEDNEAKDDDQVEKPKKRAPAKISAMEAISNGNPYDGPAGNEQETQVNSEIGSLSEVALSSSQGDK